MATVFVCAKCSAALTRSVEQLAVLPDRVEAVFPGYEPTVPPGSWAVDLKSIAVAESGEPLDSLDCVVLNSEDLLSLPSHPDRRRSSGCCGHDGLDGPNLICPECGNEVATLRDDCWTYVEVRLEPTQTVATEAL